MALPLPRAGAAGANRCPPCLCPSPISRNGRPISAGEGTQGCLKGSASWLRSLAVIWSLWRKLPRARILCRLGAGASALSSRWLHGVASGRGTRGIGACRKAPCRAPAGPAASSPRQRWRVPPQSPARLRMNPKPRQGPRCFCLTGLALPHLPQGFLSWSAAVGSPPRPPWGPPGSRGPDRQKRQKRVSRVWASARGRPGEARTGEAGRLPHARGSCSRK